MSWPSCMPMSYAARQRGVPVIAGRAGGDPRTGRPQMATAAYFAGAAFRRLPGIYQSVDVDVSGAES
jgi:hypothetical protein